MRGRGLVGLAVAVALASAAPVVGVGTARAAVPVYSTVDTGFAEGGGIADADLDRRLDGIAAFAPPVPGRSTFVRVDLDWWYVQSCAGCPPRWDRLDPVVAGAAARGLKVLVVLDYGPPWANGGHADDKWFPLRNTDWTSILDATVAHFGTSVTAYEVWNEPNNQEFGGYAGDRRLRYWQLVRLAYQRVYAGCATCLVLAGASGNGTPSTPARNDNESSAWLDWAYSNGFGRYFDAVAHHPSRRGTAASGRPTRSARCRGGTCSVRRPSRTAASWAGCVRSWSRTATAPRRSGPPNSGTRRRARPDCRWTWSGTGSPRAWTRGTAWPTAARCFSTRTATPVRTRPTRSATSEW